jgi:hypothetical protein
MQTRIAVMHLMLGVPACDSTQPVCIRTKAPVASRVKTLQHISSTNSYPIPAAPWDHGWPVDSGQLTVALIV